MLKFLAASSMVKSRIDDPHAVLEHVGRQHTRRRRLSMSVTISLHGSPQFQQ
jgi:hypothetical protein